ncbi:magnesium transporter [Vibrio mangrovi]|uniref:Magnesium transporter n=1 Tax=Vibrio mangrovi TaxID=474394 RepID=A0A1Y6IYS7_9VIBR|nr:magnesium transporter [Vibrio mangrovi]MDW6004890.1 magnesium transporter [Vibrio mangrovi]SMS01652.1 Magnesium transporter MgtE [Vibrio mangrovi]
MSDHKDLSLFIESLTQADEIQQTKQLTAYLNDGMESDTIARLLEALQVEQRVRLWRALPLEFHIAVLTDMRAEARISVIQSLTATELKLILAKLDNLSLLEWEDSLPDEIISEALRLISRDELELYDQANQYDDNQLGHWANRKVFTLPFNIRVSRAKVLLDKYQESSTPYIYLINRDKKFRGLISYADVLTAEPSAPISTLNKTNLTLLRATQPLSEAVSALEHSEYPTLPVLSDHGILIGEIDWQFSLSVQREIYEARLMAGTGIHEGDDLFAPVFKGVQKRGLWLGINLMTAILASITIGLFENVIAQVVALAVLMPIVASMGGIAGSQTLTLMVRAMALNQITAGNRWVFLKNELGIGAFNGIVWALIIGAMAGLWYQSPQLGMTIAFAIVVNIATAALFGVLIPVLLDKFKLDPALAGSVILTTVTDVVGFFAFLGTAGAILL